MAANISSATFSGGHNQGFELGNNLGRVDVNYHITPSSAFFRMPLSNPVLTPVCPCQRKAPDPVLAPPCRFVVTMTLSIATRLQRYMHGVLNQPLELDLSV